MTNINIAEIAHLSEEAFQHDNALGMDFSVNLTISGETDQEWSLQIIEQKCIIKPGSLPDSDSQVSISEENLIRLITGDLNPAMALITGRIKLSGNQNGLLKLVPLFDIDKEELNKFRDKY